MEKVDEWVLALSSDGVAKSGFTESIAIQKSTLPS